MFHRICKFLPQVYQELLKGGFSTHRANKEKPIICTGPTATKIFNKLKQAFTISAPSLILHVDLEKSFITKVYASDFALDNILS
jgi:hypothetical protein